MALATKPTAIRRLKRLPNGTMGISFVDISTGEEIPQDLLSTYNIVEQAGYEQTLADLGLEVVQPETPADTPPTENSTAESVINSGNNEENTSRSPGKQTVDDAVNLSTKGQYGYIDKPRGLGLASMIGPVTGPAKAVNTAINAKNIHAVGKAREQMGLGDRTMMEKGRNLLTGQGSYVTDVKINDKQYGTDKQYGVGFDALGPSGRTMLTPQEAAKRGRLAGNLTEATKNETKLAQLDFQAAYPTQPTGVVGNIKSAIGDFFSNLFNDSSDTSSTPQYAGENYYPSAPDSSPNSGGGETGQSYSDYSSDSPTTGGGSGTSNATSGGGSSGSSTYGGGGRDSGGSHSSDTTGLY